MAYLEYDGSTPDGSVQEVLEVTASIRQNVNGLIDALTMGGTYKGVNLTITGDPDQPDEILYERDPARLWLGVLWDSDGNPASMSYYSSRASGNAWELIGVKTVTWDADGNVTQTQWDYETTSQGTQFYADYRQANLGPDFELPSPWHTR